MYKKYALHLLQQLVNRYGQHRHNDALQTLNVDVPAQESVNKIIINPHHCSREEYQELKDYLTEKTWDWQEVSSGNDDGTSNQELIK